jgi:hypothetical protein
MITYYNDRLVIYNLIFYTLHFLSKSIYYIQQKYELWEGGRIPTLKLALFMDEVIGYFDRKCTAYFRDGNFKLLHRLEKCIHLNDEYVDK